MKLIIFDIDGTILDSVNADDECFIETFKNLYQIDLTNTDWNDFKNVTDTGLTIEIIEKWFSQTPSKEEIETIKKHFYSLLKRRVNEFAEIENALSFIKMLLEKPDFEIGFATGGWKETAVLKCSSIGLSLNDFIFYSSNDHFNRAKIIEFVIKDAFNKMVIKNSSMFFISVMVFGILMQQLISGLILLVSIIKAIISYIRQELRKLSKIMWNLIKY